MRSARCCTHLHGTYVRNRGDVITVDKSVQQLSVAIDGVTQYEWPVSNGSARLSDTKRHVSSGVVSAQMVLA